MNDCADTRQALFLESDGNVYPDTLICVDTLCDDSTHLTRDPP